MGVPVEDKKLLIARYADLKWMQELSPDYQCNRCDKILFTHYISNCDHKFCLSCKEVLTDKNKTWRCPHCQEIITDIDRQDEKFEHKLFRKSVHCLNEKYGCQVVNRLRELATHLKVCDFKEELALPEISKGKQTMDEMSKKIKNFNKDIEKLSTNMDTILEKLGQLENQEKDNRKEMDSKLEEMKEIASKSENQVEETKVTLGEKIAMLENKNNDSNNSVDGDVKNRLVQLESNILFMKLQSQSSSLLDDLWKHEPDYRWEIDALRKKMKKGTFELDDAVFELPYYSMSAKAKLQYRADETFYMSLCLTSNNSKKPLGFDIAPAVYYILKSKKKCNDRDIVRSAYYPFNSEINFQSAFVKGIFKKVKAEDDDYSEDDEVTIEIHVEPPEVARAAYSTDGALVWAIDNYRKRKKMEDDELLEFQVTPYFYTSPNGFRVQAHVCLNGDESFEGKGLTFVIRFLGGEAGKETKESFPHKTTITIINPTEPSDYFTKSVDQDIKDGKVYEINMVDYAAIEKYTTKDTLFFKIQIQAN